MILRLLTPANYSTEDHATYIWKAKTAPAGAQISPGKIQQESKAIEAETQMIKPG
jgi:hypothetical protein